MKRKTSFFRENGLSIVAFSLFVLLWSGMAITGHAAENEERAEQGLPPQTFGEYVLAGKFLSMTAENWESEFLEMALYVLLTVFLFQRGSAESKKLDEDNEVDRDPRQHQHRDVPWPVRKGGLALTLYQNSLSLAFAFLFLLAFGMHFTNSLRTTHQEQMERGVPLTTTVDYLTGPRFWFESFQNWQSEFLAIGSIVMLSIWLRQRGSPESKPVDAAHHETGGE